MMYTATSTMSKNMTGDTGEDYARDDCRTWQEFRAESDGYAAA